MALARKNVFLPWLALQGGAGLIINEVQWIPPVLRKTLFDFIKSCGSQISLKFSEVALLGLLYSPK